jgi:hypothetical protein
MECIVKSALTGRLEYRRTHPEVKEFTRIICINRKYSVEL